MERGRGMSKRGGNVWVSSSAPARPVRAPVAPLGDDWSPAGILHELYRTAPAGDEARRRLAALNVQLSVDEFHAQTRALPFARCPSECCCGECA